jgi:F420 biosynthesis protein FbiB-like protein
VNENSGDFHRLALTRQSIRRFLDEEVERGVIERILRTACHAPSAHNLQPWRFAVVYRGEVRQRLVQAMSVKFREDLIRDGLGEDRIRTMVERGEERLLLPPVAVVLCLTMEDMHPYPDEGRQRAERTMASQSVALAGGHLLLAAHAEGLGGCWICAPLFAPEVVREQLGLPASWEPQGVIILGVPAETGRDRTRKSLGEVVQWY